VKEAKAVSSAPTLLLKCLKGVQDFLGSLKTLQRNTKLRFTTSSVTFWCREIGTRRWPNGAFWALCVTSGGEKAVLQTWWL